MKNFKTKYLLSFLMMASIFVSVLSSCDDNSTDSGSASGPKIESVSLAEEGDLTPVTQGYANNMYILQGTGFSNLQKVYFNGVDTYFNPTLVTDTAIFVTIDINTPYENASNELTIITGTGTFTYTFVVAPPAPQISSYNSINALAGEVITVYGDFFLNPVVTFGTTPATVVSSTLKEIKVTVPAGSDKKYLTVSTISGSATATQSIGSAAYDDAQQGLTGQWDWGPFPRDLFFTEDVYQGKICLKMGFNGWGGYEMAYDGRDISAYKSFRIALKGAKDGSLKLVFNGDQGGWSYQIIMPLTTQWTVVEVPFSTIGNPTQFNKLTFQESGNFGGNVILMDDFGFVLK